MNRKRFYKLMRNHLQRIVKENTEPIHIGFCCLIELVANDGKDVLKYEYEYSELYKHKPVKMFSENWWFDPSDFNTRLNILNKVIHEVSFKYYKKRRKI